MSDPLGFYDSTIVRLPGPLHEEALDTSHETDHERHVVRDIVVLTLAAILAVKLMEWHRQAKRWEDYGRFDRAAFDAEMSHEFHRRLTGPLIPILSGVLLVGRGSLADALRVQVVERPATQAFATRWARAYADKVAKDYAATSAEAMAPSVATWLNTPLPAVAMAQRAKELYGLDQRATAGILGYSVPKNAKAGSRHDLIDRYLEHRAQANATVYARSAFNAGRDMLATELIESGLLPRNAKKVWVTAHDERACPVCRPMDGVAVPMHARFSVAGSHLVTPPVHPNCRCTVTVDQHPREGFVIPDNPEMMASWLKTAVRSVFR